MQTTDLSSAHVLVLEDEPLILMDVENMLADMGCATVTSVRTAEAAMAALRRKPIHLAVLDIQLRQGNSYEVAASLKARNIPFVFASGSRGTEVPKWFAEVPFADKPFDRPALRQQLRDALHGGRG